MLERIEKRFRAIAPPVEYYSLRIVRERRDYLSVRQNVVQPVSTSDDLGAMITVTERGGSGYAATGDVSQSGLRRAAEQARTWAAYGARRGMLAHLPQIPSTCVGEYRTPVSVGWQSIPLGEKIGLLHAACAQLKIDDRIVDWQASLWFTQHDTLYTTPAGGRVRQQIYSLVPELSATANAGSESQTRTFGGSGACRQGGLEALQLSGFHNAAPRIAADALQLLLAPNCPTGTLDVILAADQMMLQIHESIGHPLELDRILGDERNYAGRSFVRPDMFGHYRYGSELLNVTSDPSRPEQFASYGFDDDGHPARREYLIRNGILLRGLGGVSSQLRSGLPGVAVARASGWNRPVIDRMANLNLEPGCSRFADLVGAVERGVYLKTNRSWSIDDSRNKFQFGCEWGRLIEHGRLAGVEKNPNYRGISATFWQNLRLVGDRDCFEVLGTPFCGKGEPNQAIRVGHAAPACLFAEIDVFGGD